MCALVFSRFSIRVSGVANLRSSNLGERGRRSWEWYRPKERWWVAIYAFYSNFSSILCVSEILPRLCSSTPLFSHPTISLPQISHVHTIVHRAVKWDVGLWMSTRESKNNVNVMTILWLRRSPSTSVSISPSYRTMYRDLKIFGGFKYSRSETMFSRL